MSHNKDRLAIYKPGAVYCVQTLPQENEGAIVQHCCYDENRKLLTRGSGAGTPYIVSPDISPLLHDKLDLLPWRLCKGDFTRYANLANLKGIKKQFELPSCRCSKIRLAQIFDTHIFLLNCRYNEVRIPNNVNNCEINPDNEEYQRQVEKAKDY